MNTTLIVEKVIATRIRMAIHAHVDVKATKVPGIDAYTIDVAWAGTTPVVASAQIDGVLVREGTERKLDEWVRAALLPAMGHAATPEHPAPTVGRTVHYVAYGTPGGEYAAGAHRAAIVTAVLTREVVSLCILNPTGLFFAQNLELDPTGTKPGTWHWPERT